MKILFSGGGTLGPVTPLLAVSEIYAKRYPKTEFVWVGTKNGPEKELVEKYHIPFFSISAGKLRRYQSALNVADFFKIGFGFLQSLVLLWQEKPDLIVSAGGFVSVPVHWAAIMLGIPAWIHQQDFQVGLANKIMAKSAKKITVAISECSLYFPENKTEWLGNPVRDLSGISQAEGKQKFNIPADQAVVFVLGGGTGSASVNNIILSALPRLSNNIHVIHLIGRQRSNMAAEKAAEIFKNYHVFPFFADEMKYAYAAADVVVARAGFGTISELSSLKKASVLIPMSNTHQEKNARYLADNKGVIFFDETVNDAGVKLAHILLELTETPEVRTYLGERLYTILPPAIPERIIEIIDSLGSQE